jgi:flagellar basal body-associated protein FliL
VFVSSDADCGDIEAHGGRRMYLVVVIVVVVVVVVVVVIVVLFAIFQLLRNESL